MARLLEGVEHEAYALRGHVGHDAVGGEAVVARVEDALRARAAQDVHHRGLARRAAPLGHAQHAAHHLLGLHRCVLLLHVNRAVGAVLAAPRLRGLAEVAQQVGAQAVGGGAVERHLLEALAVALVQQGRRLGVAAVGLGVVAAAVDEELAGLHVFLVVDEDAVGRGPVAAGAARLLIVSLQVGGHVVVDDKAHVGLVDAHAEGVGGHHHAGAVVEELVLVGAALLGGKARVVARGGEALLPEQVAHVLHGLAGGAVHDARLPRARRRATGVAQGGAGGHEAHERRVLVARLGALHAEVEVGPVEAAHKHEGLAQLQGVHDVGAHLLGGRRGERSHAGTGGQALHETGYLAVVGAEVLAPLRHAVRLVHGDEVDGHGVGELGQARAGEALGRHIEQTDLPGRRTGEGIGLLGGAERGVDARGGDASLFQARHLVFHERDEGRHHKREAGQHERGDLVDDGLARARGHDAQHVAALEHRGHQVALVGAEVVVAEALLEQRTRSAHGRRVGGGGGVAAGRDGMLARLDDGGTCGDGLAGLGGGIAGLGAGARGDRLAGGLIGAGRLGNGLVFGLVGHLGSLRHLCGMPAIVGPDG